MEGGGESIFDAIFDEDGGEDVEMLDVEEGELLDDNNAVSQTTQLGRNGAGDVDLAMSREPENQNQKTRKNRKKKKKNKKKKGGEKKGGYGSNITDINKFVVDTCKRLRERKSYLVWTAVGCLGVSALSDLVKEVDAIQTCGGQKTADGRRFKTGGGILWNILKAHDPNVFKEIMKKGREFEKQFKQAAISQVSAQNNPAPQPTPPASMNQTTGNLSDDTECVPHMQDQLEKSNSEQKRKPVHERIRVPITYDDLVGGPEDPKDDLADIKASVTVTPTILAP